MLRCALRVLDTADILRDGALDGADRVPMVGKQVGIELISVIGGNVDIARIRQNARNLCHFSGTLTGRSRSGNRRQNN